jgi:hypothetical protein
MGIADEILPPAVPIAEPGWEEREKDMKDILSVYELAKRAKANGAAH